jgi:hypothetical protein
MLSVVIESNTLVPSTRYTGVLLTPILSLAEDSHVLYTPFF